MKKVFLFLSVLMLSLISSASAQDKVLVNDLEQYISNSKSDKINVVVSGVTDKNQGQLQNALQNCKKPIIMELASDPKLTKIGSAFAESSLESIVIPEGVRSVNWSFTKCQLLKNVELPSSITEIWGLTFGDCNALESITIPENVVELDMFAFYNCTALKSVSLPKGLKWIGCNTFGNCTSLEAIDIPDGVEYVDFAAFEGCTSLSALNVPKNAGWGKTKYENGYIRSIELLADRYDDFYHRTSFSDLKFLETVVVSDGISYIRNYMFKGCESLKSVVIPEGVEDIPFCAFEGCTSLESLKIPKSAVWGDYKFENGHLVSIEMPDDINKIDFKVFSDCKNLESIFVSKALYDKYHKKHSIIKLKK